MAVATTQDVALVLRSVDGGDFLAHSFGIDGRAVAAASAEAAAALAAGKAGLDGSGDAPPSLERGDLLVASASLRAVYRRVGRVLVLALTPAAASAAAAARAVDDAALVLVAAARSADVSADRIARRYPEAWLALALLLAGPPPPAGGRVDAAAALAAARAALAGAVARDDDATLTPVAVSSAGASAAATAALKGALTSALRRPPSPGRPATPPPGQPPRRRRLADVAAAGGGGIPLPQGALDACVPVVGGGAAAAAAAADAAAAAAAADAPPRAPDDVSMLMELVGGEQPAPAAAAAATGWAAFGEPSATAPSAAFPPVSLLTAAPAPTSVSAAAAEGWASFDAEPTAAPVVGAAVGVGARAATDQETAAVASGSAFVLHETWKAAFVGDRLARAGVAGEVRLCGVAARAVGSKLPARVALIPPTIPAADSAAAVVAAGLKCARADPGLVDGGNQRGRGAVVAVGAAAAAARAPLLYRLPAVAIQPPLAARLRLVPAPAGAAGAVLVAEWRLAATAPRFKAGLLTLTVPDAAGDLLRASPRAAWHPPSRTLAWRVRDGEGAVRCAFGPPPGAPPDALAACGVPGGGPAAAARGATAVLELSEGDGGLTGAAVASGAVKAKTADLGRGAAACALRVEMSVAPAG